MKKKMKQARTFFKRQYAAHVRPLMAKVKGYFKHVWFKFKNIFKHPKYSFWRTLSFVLYWWERFVIGIIVAVVLIFPTVAFVTSTIDTHPDFIGEEASLPQLQSVSTAEALLYREVSEYGWKANQPLIFPSGWLDNMPSFQMGIIDALQNFTASMPDPKLQKAGELLSYPGDIWYVNWDTYFKPTTPAGREYKKARALLDAYNKTATQHYEVEDLETTLEAMQRLLRQSEHELTQKINEDAHESFSFDADNVFYRVKGRMYADSLLLRDLKQDYAGFVSTPGIEESFNETIHAFQSAAAYQPWFVINGKVDGTGLPSHLSTQGFYVMKAIDKLRSLSDLLEKAHD